VLLAATLLAALVPAGPVPAAPATPAGYAVTGLDASQYQGTISWAPIAATGARFTYLKSTEGLTFVDPAFPVNYPGAKRAGLYAGAYHFARPDKSTGTAQADYFLDHAQVAADGRTLPPMLDIEWPWSGSSSPYPCYGLAQPAMVAWIHAFIDRVRARTGRPTMIYTNSNWWGPCTGNDPGFGANPLFQASYTATPPKPPPGWNAWTLWQYTSGSNPPLVGDQDVFNGNLAQLGVLAGGSYQPTGYRDDLAWYQPGALYRLTGTGLDTLGQLPLAGAPTWAGAGDYNHDGRDDLFWYYASNGSLHVLLAGGTTFASIGMVRGPGIGAPDWAGVGDFDGDGYTDDLAWLQGGTLFTFSGPKLATTGAIPLARPDWAGVGDYNHDGRDDLFWYYASNGSVHVLLSTRRGFRSAGMVRGPGIGAPDWAGVGDFDGDGYAADLAWAQSGALFAFTGPRLETTGATTVARPDWGGVGDYNHDGRDDLFWYAATDGSLAVLAATGTGFAAPATVRGPGLGVPAFAAVGGFG